MSVRSKHRHAASGHKATFNGIDMIVHQVDDDALTLVTMDKSMYVGVSRRDKRLRVSPPKEEPAG